MATKGSSKIAEYLHERVSARLFQCFDIKAVHTSHANSRPSYKNKIILLVHEAYMWINSYVYLVFFIYIDLFDYTTTF